MSSNGHVGRPPARYKVTSVDEHGKITTKATNNAVVATSWLYYFYGLGNEVEIEDREGEITLRGV